MIQAHLDTPFFRDMILVAQTSSLSIEKVHLSLSGMQ